MTERQQNIIHYSNTPHGWMFEDAPLELGCQVVLVAHSAIILINNLQRGVHCGSLLTAEAHCL